MQLFDMWSTYDWYESFGKVKRISSVPFGCTYASFALLIFLFAKYWLRHYTSMPRLFICDQQWLTKRDKTIPLLWWLLFSVLVVSLRKLLRKAIFAEISENGLQPGENPPRVHEILYANFFENFRNFSSIFGYFCDLFGTFLRSFWDLSATFLRSFWDFFQCFWDILRYF